MLTQHMMEMEAAVSVCGLGAGASDDEHHTAETAAVWFVGQPVWLNLLWWT